MISQEARGTAVDAKQKNEKKKEKKKHKRHEKNKDKKNKKKKLRAGFHEQGEDKHLFFTTTSAGKAVARPACRSCYVNGKYKRITKAGKDCKSCIGNKKVEFTLGAGSFEEYVAQYGIGTRIRYRPKHGFKAVKLAEVEGIKRKHLVAYEGKIFMSQHLGDTDSDDKDRADLKTLQDAYTTTTKDPTTTTLEQRKAFIDAFIVVTKDSGVRLAANTLNAVGYKNYTCTDVQSRRTVLRVYDSTDSSGLNGNQVENWQLEEFNTLCDADGKYGILVVPGNALVDIIMFAKHGEKRMLLMGFKACSISYTSKSGLVTNFISDKKDHGYPEVVLLTGMPCRWLVLCNKKEGAVYFSAIDGKFKNYHGATLIPNAFPLPAASIGANADVAPTTCVLTHLMSLPLTPMAKALDIAPLITSLNSLAAAVTELLAGLILGASPPKDTTIGKADLCSGTITLQIKSGRVRPHNGGKPCTTFKLTNVKGVPYTDIDYIQFTAIHCSRYTLRMFKPVPNVEFMARVAVYKGKQASYSTTQRDDLDLPVFNNAGPKTFFDIDVRKLLAAMANADRSELDTLVAAARLQLVTEGPLLTRAYLPFDHAIGSREHEIYSGWLQSCLRREFNLSYPSAAAMADDVNADVDTDATVTDEDIDDEPIPKRRVIGTSPK